MNRFALLLLLSIAQSGFSADTVTVPVKDIRPETAFSVTAHVFSRDGSMRIDACSDGSA